MAEMKPPRGLGNAGKALWKQIISDLPTTADGWRASLDEREQALLFAACRQLDDITRLETEIKKSGAMATGSQGQAVVNPAVIEARQGRTVLARLLGQIEIPDEDGKPTSNASQVGRKAAKARWDKQRRIKERRAAQHG